MQANPFEGRPAPGASTPTEGEALGASVVLGTELQASGPTVPPLVDAPRHPRQLEYGWFDPTFAHPQLWVLGLNGGCGTTTLTTLLRAEQVDARELPVRYWPCGTQPGPIPNVLLVASTHAAGMTVVEAAAAQWARKQLPLRLVGLVLVSDAPGRNKAMKPRWEAAKGLTPALWHIPWQESWRNLTADDPRPLDFRTRATVRAIRRTLERKTS